MKIRKGKAADMPAVLRLIKELATFEKEPDAVVLTVDDLIKDGFSDTPAFYTFVAEENTTIIGIALYYFRYSTWKGRTLHLEDLIVTETKRGTGAGKALYEAVIKEGYNQNVRRIEWAVLEWNKRAIDFYNKSGAKVLEDWRVVQIDENGIQKLINKTTM